MDKKKQNILILGSIGFLLLIVGVLGYMLFTSSGTFGVPDTSTSTDEFSEIFEGVDDELEASTEEETTDNETTITQSINGIGTFTLDPTYQSIIVISDKYSSSIDKTVTLDGEVIEFDSSTHYYASVVESGTHEIESSPIDTDSYKSFYQQVFLIEGDVNDGDLKPYYVTHDEIITSTEEEIEYEEETDYSGFDTGEESSLEESNDEDEWVLDDGIDIDESVDDGSDVDEEEPEDSSSSSSSGIPSGWVALNVKVYSSVQKTYTSDKTVVNGAEVKIETPEGNYIYDKSTGEKSNVVYVNTGSTGLISTNRFYVPETDKSVIITVPDKSGKYWGSSKTLSSSTDKNQYTWTLKVCPAEIEILVESEWIKGTWSEYWYVSVIDYKVSDDLAYNTNYFKTASLYNLLYGKIYGSSYSDAYLSYSVDGGQTFKKFAYVIDLNEDSETQTNYFTLDLDDGMNTLIIKVDYENDANNILSTDDGFYKIFEVQDDGTLDISYNYKEF